MGEYAARRTKRMLHATGATRGDFESGAQKMSKLAMVTLSRALAGWNLTPSFTVKVPSLVLVGDADPYVSVAMARDLAGRIEGSRLVVLPGAGHICNSDSPSAFNHGLADFLVEVGWMASRGRGADR